MPMPLRLSIVICTYNRADLARQAIASVLAQDFPRSEYELLVVDNRSTDHTGAMTQEFCASNPNVRYLIEKEIGLSHARNCGWQAARGEYVAYIDDDCKVPPSWLSAAFGIIAGQPPLAFGGPYYAFYNSPKPAWFKDEYGSHTQGTALRPLQAGEYLDGGNMFIRLDILKRLGGFDTGFGMQGQQQAYGEETELFYRIRQAVPDAVILYDPSLYVYHLVRPEKMKMKAIIRTAYLSGLDYARGIRPDVLPGKFRLAIQAGVLLLQILKSATWDLLRRDRNQFPYYQNVLYEVSLPLIARLGSTLGWLRGKNMV